MHADLTLIVTYAQLDPEREAAMATWRRLHPDTWFCQQGSGGGDRKLPADWQQMPPQSDAASVGQAAVGYGEGDWLMVVDALDQPDPLAFHQLLTLLPALDPRTIYLLPVPVSNRLVDVQPRLLHRTGHTGTDGANAAADLGLQMALLPVWPLIGSDAETAWMGIQDADPLIGRLVRGEGPADETIPDPGDPHVAYSLRLLLADDDRLHGELDSAMGWVEPVLDQGPPALQAMAGLIHRDRGDHASALTALHRAWRAENLVQWPGYYPRAVVDQRLVGEAIAECYRKLGVIWAADLMAKLAATPDRERRYKFLLAAMSEQAGRGRWAEWLGVATEFWRLEEPAADWLGRLAGGDFDRQLVEAEIWEWLESQGTKTKRAVSLFQRLAKAHPDDPRPWQRLGSRALVEERWQDADEAFVRASRDSQAPGWVWNSLGVAQVRQQKLIEAETSFRRALEAGEPEPSAQRNLQELQRLLARQLRPSP